MNARSAQVKSGSSAKTSCEAVGVRYSVPRESLSAFSRRAGREHTLAEPIAQRVEHARGHATSRRPLAERMPRPRKDSYSHVGVAASRDTLHERLRGDLCLCERVLFTEDTEDRATNLRQCCTRIERQNVLPIPTHLLDRFILAA